MIAEVLVEYRVKSLDKTFTYKIPDFLRDKLKVGMKVKIPFGSLEINGFVLKILSNTTNMGDLKEIKCIVDEYFILNDELLELGKYLKEKTLCSLMTAYQTMLPSSLKIKTQKNNYQLYNTYVYLNNKVDIEQYITQNKRSKKQIELINLLKQEGKILKSKVTCSSLKILIEKNIILEIKEQKYRINIENNVLNDQTLTQEQNEAYQKIIKYLDNEKTFLLHGVTGSGKTEIYIHLIREVIKRKERALLLLPEITLTTQIVKRLYERFGSNVAIFHSALSQGEKYDEYKKILNNKIDVVVGTRSSIFTPINNLGIIIIDEEHSDNYKQDNTPRYQTIDMALFRSHYNKIPLVLGSATPKLESMARAKKGIYELITLSKRVGNSTLPTITLVDMQQEMKKRNMVISDKLKNKIIEKLEKKEQIILLLNRRGHSTIVTCQNCGFTYKCPYCDITLTYHKTSNKLRCHYCGYTIFKQNTCPSCHEESLNFYGLGTEKLELQLTNMFPNARIIRMDTDTTTKKGSHEKIIKKFQNQEYDILLGTQMIAKGLDFPNVTLVGIINADISLNMPDFKSRERTVELLMQTSGRAGRSDKAGEVIIQTTNVDNPIFKYVINNDYNGFYCYEMLNRHKLDYPPYYYLTSIKVTSKDYEIASIEANKIVKYLKNNLDSKTIILGPTTASMFKLNNIYRFQIIIKYKKDNNLDKILKELDNLYILNKQVNLEIDLSPLTI